MTSIIKSFRSISVALFGLAALVSAQGPAQPNVLFIYVEDLNYDLGAFGHPVVQTPNITALAQRGVRFERAYCPYPLCAPSRLATMLGQRATTTTLMGNRAGMLPGHTLQGVPILPKRFKDAGYITGGTGKLFHDQQVHPDTWDTYTSQYRDPGIAFPANPLPQESWRVVYGGPYMNGPQGQLGKMEDTKNSDIAIGMIAALPQPWFIGIGYNAPHVPYIYPEQFHSLYDPAVDVPPLPPEEASGAWKNSVPAEMWQSPNFVDPAWGTTLDERRRQAQVAYWRTITYVDHEVGRVLSQLQAVGRQNDTIVVLVSDHGWSMGLHDRYGKFALYDHEVTAPMIVAVPWETAGHGQACSRPVTSLDIYPTLMDYCGLVPPAGLEGDTLRPQLQNPSTPTDPVFSVLALDWESRWMHMVATDRYKYIYHPRTAAGQQHMLFDLVTDPGEYVNLYNDPAYAYEVAAHHQLLENEGLLNANWSNYGGGGTGTLGTPTLTLDGPPRLGQLRQIQIGNSQGTATVGLLVSGWAAQRLEGPGIAGGPFLVRPVTTEFFSIPVGGVQRSFQVPPSTTFLGSTLRFQTAQLDSGTPYGAAFSAGLRLFFMPN